MMPPLAPAQPRTFVPLPLRTPLNVTVIPSAMIVLSAVPPVLPFPVKVRLPVPRAPKIICNCSGGSSVRWFRPSGEDGLLVSDFTFREYSHNSAGLDRKSTRLNSSHLGISY